MKKVVVTGANSFVASHFVHALLTQDYYVIALVRGNESRNAAERMQQALHDTTLDMPIESGHLEILEYELLEPDFAIAEDELNTIFSGYTYYFHFAASLKFDHRSKEEIYETNIGGVENALRIFHKYTSSPSQFIFISTAYSCGTFNGVFEEKFYPDAPVESFRNYYEQSKRLAENVVEKYIEEERVNAHVIRLSQVVGNSRTGVTRTNYGIFDFAKRVQTLAKKYPNRTLRIKADPDATQNLIPIDSVVHDLISVVEMKKPPVIINLVANRPIQNRKIIRSISDLLPIELIPDRNIKVDDMNKLEKIILAGMAFTGNYIDTNISFDTTQRDKVISSGHKEVNESSVFAMLAYYIDQIWEKKVLVKSGHE